VGTGALARPVERKLDVKNMWIGYSYPTHFVFGITHLNASSRTSAYFSRRRDLARITHARGAPREIPRPPGECAGLRNEAI